MTIFEATNSILIQLEGQLDVTTAPKLQEQFSALQPDQHSLWILDMAGVDFIDSAGLVALVTGQKMANRQACRLALCNLRPPVKLIFEITQLDRVFEIFDTHHELVEVEPVAESKPATDVSLTPSNAGAIAA